MLWKKTALAMTLVAGTSLVAFAQQDEGQAAEKLNVEVEGVLVQADWNSDYLDQTDPAKRAEMKDSIEGSVSFMVDVPFKKIVQHMQDAGTLGKISPNITQYKADKVKEDDNQIHYKVEEELAPFKFPLLSGLGKTKVYLDLFINKRAIKDGRLVVDYYLDPTKENGWKRFEGHIYAVDTHNGKTMCMVATSTKSKYNIMGAMRLKLAKHYLAKTKDNIVTWLQGLGH